MRTSPSIHQKLKTSSHLDDGRSPPPPPLLPPDPLEYDPILDWPLALLSLNPSETPRALPGFTMPP